MGEKIMAFVAAKCTQCGGSLQVDNSKDAGICPFCGTAFVTEKVIKNYNIHITNKIDTVVVQNSEKGRMKERCKPIWRRRITMNCMLLPIIRSDNIQTNCFFIPAACFQS